ncbi:MAG: AI-2E family transporter [Chloroflexi bacterium]|nr:AI-2E family transporter [Chloroflexota bacterium]
MTTSRGAGAQRPRTVDTLSVVPPWLGNMAALGWRILVVVALLVVLAVGARQLWVVSATIVLSIVVAAVLAPAVLRLRARGRSRTAAALIVWAVGMLVGAALLVLLAVAFAPHLATLVHDLRAGAAAIEAEIEAHDLPPAVGVLWHEAFDLGGRLLGDVIGELVASAASVVTAVILSVFLIFFLLRDGDRGWLWAFQSLGDPKRARITSAGSDALMRIGGYLRGTTILAALMGATTYLFLVLLGVPLAGALSLLVFVAGYVPVVGGIVSTAAVLIVAFATGGLGTTLVLLVLFGVRGAVMGSLVRPSVYGRTVSIHPALVLIVLPAGYELAGVVGLVAAVPVTAVVIAVASAVVAIVAPDPPPPLPGIVPPWLDRFAQWGWRILVVLALVGVAVLVAVLMPLVVTPVVVALVVAATLDPLVAALVRRGWGRTRASVVAVGGSALLVMVLLALATVSLVTEAGAIGAGIEAGARSADGSAGGSLGLGVAAAVQGATRLVHEVRVVLSFAGALGSVGAVLLLGLLLAIFLLRDGGRLWARIVGRTPDVHRSAVDAAGSRAVGVLGGYMVGTAAVSGVGAASQWLIMVILGIPLALPVAVLSFILCFIPYLGGFLSTGIAFLLAIAYGSPLDVLIMGIWTIVFNIVQGNIVSPLVYGRTVSLHPAVVLLAIPAAGAVAGIVGMFMVVPALGVVAVSWRPVMALLGGTGTEAPGIMPGDVAATTATDPVAAAPA